jgi:hypothetical protein
MPLRNPIVTRSGHPHRTKFIEAFGSEVHFRETSLQYVSGGSPLPRRDRFGKKIAVEPRKEGENLGTQAKETSEIAERKKPQEMERRTMENKDANY